MASTDDAEPASAPDTADEPPPAAPAAEGQARTRDDDLPVTGVPVALYGLAGFSLVEAGWGLLLLRRRLVDGPIREESELDDPWEGW